jgi:hypothetical protein
MSCSGLITPAIAFLLPNKHIIRATIAFPQHPCVYRSPNTKSRTPRRIFHTIPVCFQGSAARRKSDFKKTHDHTPPSNSLPRNDVADWYWSFTNIGNADITYFFLQERRFPDELTMPDTSVRKWILVTTFPFIFVLVFSRLSLSRFLGAAWSF